MKKPNILYIMCDQLKATASHLYGNEFCRTPNLEKLSKQGVLFENTFTPHPLCVPARVSLWTARYPHNHGARRNETFLGEGIPHAFKLWKDAGFKTGLIGKNHCFKREEDYECFDVWNEMAHYGFRDTTGPGVKGLEWCQNVDDINKGHATRHNMPKLESNLSWAVTDYPLELYSNSLVTDQTIKFLEEYKDEPFALWLSFPDPHEPYEAPRKYAEMFSKDKVKLPEWPEGEFNNCPEKTKILKKLIGIDHENEEDLYGFMSCYFGNVKFIDDCIGKLMDTLDRLELRKNTIVVFTADHGDFTLEHRMVRKGNAFYDSLTRIPLIMSYPGTIPEGKIDTSMANLIDTVPTILELQGLEQMPGTKGKPLPTVTDAKPREAVFSEYGAGGPDFRLSHLNKMEKSEGPEVLIKTLQWREAEGRRKMVRTKDWKYVHEPGFDTDELYDMKNDPNEFRNLANDPTCSDKVIEMKSLLTDWAMETEDSYTIPMPDPKKYQL